jgi:transposase
MANLNGALTGVEASSGAHFIRAALRDHGHEVRLIPAQFVEPFVKIDGTMNAPGLLSVGGTNDQVKV